ncbi:ABC transporter ATP-binding protein [Brachybacterium sp. FME24]|uniref:ABC transporter ATP-binding protein n=1 Tax=Brachybacterium sp. FME24 TaxID=2742605 RepID=UPI001866D913|nr:ABC transporter ATP-binding protein [Brachybacterium sp. FME24]
MRTIAWISRRAFLAAPGIVTWTSVIALALAAVPALQVLLIAELILALGDTDRLRDLAGLLLAMILLVGLTPSVSSICGDFQHRAAQRLQAELNSSLVREASRIAPDELVNSSIAAQVERHSRAIGEGIAWSFSQYMTAVMALLSSVGVIVAVFSFSAVAGVLTLFSLIPPLVYSRYLSRVWERQWEEVSPHYDKERYLRELIVRQRSATELAGLGTSERVGEMVAARWRIVDSIMAKALRPQVLGNAASGIVSAVLLGGAILAVVIGAQFESPAVAGIYGVMAAMTASAGAGLSAGLAIENLPLARGLQRFLSAARPSRRHPPAPVVQHLRAEHLTHRYGGRDQDAITDVSIEARLGDVVALVGVNGAGKTTTVNALLGLVTPQDGEVLLDGENRTDLGEAAWLARFGLLTQEFGRFELTVRDAVRLGSPREDVTDAEVWDALHSAHAAGMVAAMPEGLDQQLGEQWGGVGISGGQWQRLALARTYLRNAPIWVLDEPTSAIDAEAEQEIFHELQRTKHGRITVVVSHRAWTLKEMDRIYVFGEGRVVEQGTYEDLLAHDGRFAAIFAEQR